MSDLVLSDCNGDESPRGRGRTSMHLALGATPIGLAHLLAVELSRGGLGNLRPELDRLRRLHASQLFLAVRNHVGLGKTFAQPGNDDRLNRFSHFSSGTPITAHSCTCGSAMIPASTSAQ